MGQYRCVSVLFFVMLFFVTIFASYNVLNISTHPKQSDSMLYGSTKIPSQITPSIVITSDQDFVSQGWPGNGTASDPFIIEGLSFNTFTPAISVRNTRAYFQIINCTVVLLSSMGIAIQFANVTHGTVKMTMVVGGFVNVDQSTNCTFLDNYFYNNNYGLFFSFSSSITVEHCIFEKLEDGVTFVYCENISFKENTIKYCDTGLSLTYTTGNSIIKNTFIYCGVNVDPFSLSQTMFHQNSVNWKPLGFFKNLMNRTISGNDYGQIIIYNCTQFELVGGSFLNVSTPIFILSSNNIDIHNFYIYNGQTGVEIWSSSNVSICWATITSCTCAISIDMSYNIRVMGCTFSKGMLGLDVNGTTGIFENNYFYEFMSIGISLLNINGLEINNNIFESCDEALYASFCDELGINNNTFRTSWIPIYFYTVNNSYFSNNYVTNSTSGVVISYCSYINITHNIIYNNSQVGLLITMSHKCTVSSNILYYNNIGILIQHGSANVIYGNHLTLNNNSDAIDNGFDNIWYDGIDLGNYWYNYTGHGNYLIPGIAEATDPYPRQSDLDGDGIPDIEEIRLHLDPLVPDFVIPVYIPILLSGALILCAILYRRKFQRVISS